MKLRLLRKKSAEILQKFSFNKYYKRLVLLHQPLFFLVDVIHTPFLKNFLSSSTLRHRSKLKYNKIYNYA